MSAKMTFWLRAQTLWGLWAGLSCRLVVRLFDRLGVAKCRQEWRHGRSETRSTPESPNPNAHATQCERSRTPARRIPL